jgi:hypothetical protein
MKIKLNMYVDGTYKEQDLHDDFSGITTFNQNHGGQYRVKEISSIAIGYDGTLSVFAQPLERDLPVKEETPEAAFLPEPAPIAKTEETFAVPF